MPNTSELQRGTKITSDSKKLKKSVRIAVHSPIGKIQRIRDFIYFQSTYILGSFSCFGITEFENQQSKETVVGFLTNLFYKSIFYTCFLSVIVSILKNVKTSEINIKKQIITRKQLADSLFFASVVYGAFASILIQFIMACYLLSFALIPLGFLILISLMLTTTYLLYKIIFFYIYNSDKCQEYVLIE